MRRLVVDAFAARTTVPRSALSRTPMLGGTGTPSSEAATDRAHGLTKSVDFLLNAAMLQLAPGVLMPRLVKRSTVPLVSMLLILGLLALAPSARAWSGYKHGSAQSKKACAAGCHAETAPTNTTCTGCHTGFKTRGTQKCWDCHEPGQSTTSLQLLAGCTATCHISTATGDRPSYTVSFTHSETVHAGASGYGRTCLDCHDVSTGGTAPGTSPTTTRRTARLRPAPVVTTGALQPRRPATQGTVQSARPATRAWTGPRAPARVATPASPTRRCLRSPTPTR